MRYRTLGRTGLQVSEIGLGGLFLSSESHDIGIQIVHRALELGINFFDCAPSYFKGASEAVLGEALQGRREPHFISTKLYDNMIEGFDYTYDTCMRSFEGSLKRLRRDRVDVLMIHDPDRNVDGSYRPVFGKGMALETCQKLKEQGLIKAIGLGSLWLDYQAHCIDTGFFDVVLTFNRYGLIWRDAQFQTFPFMRRHNVGVIQGTPLHQGVLAVRRDEWIENPPEWMTVREHEAFRKLYDIQSRAGLPLPELAIRFVLSHPTISLTIPGAANVEQLEANVAAAARGPLPEGIQAEIEALGLLHDDPKRYI
jgi:aryl-alcohol dehydrogenase-like predicted oxidoreductase